MQQNNLRDALPRPRSVSYPVLLRQLTCAMHEPRPPAVTQLLNDSASNRWILNGFLDVFFACGGLLALILLIVAVAPYQVEQMYGAIFLTASILFADSHNAATIVRIIEEPGIYQRHPFISVWLPVALTIVIPIFAFTPMVLSWALNMYLIFISQHVTAQSYGMVMLYLRKTKIVLGEREAMAVKLAFRTIMIAGIERLLSTSSTLIPAVDGMRPLFALPEWLFTVCSIVAVVYSLYAVAILYDAARESKVALHPAAILIIASTLAIFTLGGYMGSLALYAPAFFHASQYIVICAALNATGYGTKERAGSPARQMFSEANLQYLLKLASVGLFFYVLVPSGIVSLTHIELVTAMAIMFCLVNFHHFTADAFLWRTKYLRKATAPVLMLLVCCGLATSPALAEPTTGEIASHSVSPVVAQFYAPVVVPSGFSPTYPPPASPAQPAASVTSRIATPAAVNGVVPANVGAASGTISPAPGEVTAPTYDYAKMERTRRNSEALALACLILGAVLAGYGFVLLIISLVSPKPLVRVCTGLGLIIFSVVFTTMLMQAVMGGATFGSSCGATLFN
jgi:hypothetical protein